MEHGQITYIETKAECRHLKKLVCKGILRQVFIDRRYSQSCWYFRPSFLKCCPSNPLSDSTLPTPLPCVNKYAIHIHYTVWKGGGGAVLGLRQMDTYRKVPLLLVNFLFRWRHFAWPSMSLSFHGWEIKHCFNQCCGSGSESGSTGSTCFWSSWMRIRILLSLSKNSTKNLDFYCIVTSFWLFIFEKWCKCTFKK